MRLNRAVARTLFAAGRSDLFIAGGGFLIALTLLAAVPLIETDSYGVTSSLPLRDPAWWATVVTIAIQAATLAFSQGFPRLVPIMTAAVSLPLAALAPGSSFSATTVSVVAAVYFAGIRNERRGTALVASVIFPVILVSTAMNLAGASPATPFPVLAGAGQAAVVVGTPLSIALVVVSRRRASEAQARELSALHRERHALVREQDARVASAIAVERTSVARDLHDIAAHHMSGIALLAAAIEREVDASPASAKTAANDIRVQSTAVLGDLRRIVGLLRDDNLASLADRSLASIAQLVEERRASGTDVSLAIDSDKSPLGNSVSALAQIVGYRMVQESLANAAVHAPGAACNVVIRTENRQTKIVVRNEAGLREPSSDVRRQGFGLVGMRERAELVGAALDYGPTNDSGWSVTLDLPHEPEATNYRRNNQG